MTARFVWTQAAGEVAQAVDRVRQSREVLLLLGDAGCGKTRLVRELCTPFDERATPWQRRLLGWQVDVPNTPRGLTRALLEMLELPALGTTVQNFGLLVQALRTRQIDGIVIDDAQWLSAPSYEVLRRLNQAAGVAVVLCGTRRAERLLQHRCPEMAARVRVHHVFGVLRPQDVFNLLVALCGERGRRRVWELVEASRVLCRACCGNLSRVASVIEAARRLARRQRRSLCGRFIRQAVEGRQAA